MTDPRNDEQSTATSPGQGAVQSPESQQDPIRKKPESTVWALWFLAILLIPVVLSVVEYRPQAMEAVELQTTPPPPSPGFSPDRFLDTAYYRQLDAFIQQDLATRDLALRARHFLDVKLLPGSTNWLEIRGNDGWWLWAIYQDPPCEDLAIAFPGVVSDNVPVYSMVTAPKGAIHPEVVPKAWAPEPCVGEARQRRNAQAEEDPFIIDVDQPLAEVAMNGTPVFYKQDTHWNVAGQLVVAETIMGTLGPGLWDPADIVDTTSQIVMPLGNPPGELSFTTVADFAIDRGEVVVDQRSDSGFAQLISLQVTRSMADEVVPGTTWIFGDSQAATILPELEPFFERLVYVNWLQVDVGRRDFTLLPAPDRIVVQSVEASARARFETFGTFTFPDPQE